MVVDTHKRRRIGGHQFLPARQDGAPQQLLNAEFFAHHKDSLRAVTSVIEASESRGVLFMKYKELTNTAIEQTSMATNVAREMTTGEIGLNASAIRVNPAAHMYRLVATACTKTTTAPAHTRNSTAIVALPIGNFHNIGRSTTSATAEINFIGLVIMRSLESGLVCERNYAGRTWPPRLRAVESLMRLRGWSCCCRTS